MGNSVVSSIITSNPCVSIVLSLGTKEETAQRYIAVYGSSLVTRPTIAIREKQEDRAPDEQFETMKHETA